jgi:AraC-like DNA-binding protein
MVCHKRLYQALALVGGQDRLPLQRPPPIIVRRHDRVTEAGGRRAAILGLLAAQRDRPAAAAPDDPLARRLARAADLLRRNRARPLRIAEAAAAAGLSEGHFRTAFARRYGVAPLQFLIDERLRELRRLLGDDPGLAIHAAARLAGFADPRHAGRLFKARFGVTPDGFRKALPVR